MVNFLRCGRMRFHTKGREKLCFTIFPLKNRQSQVSLGKNGVIFHRLQNQKYVDISWLIR